jgi:hypothetical protein
VRRSRIGWTWASGRDVPLGEESEAYRVTLTGAAGGGRTATVGTPSFFYPAADQAADGVSGTLSAEVVQLGTYAPSRPARLTDI